MQAFFHKCCFSVILFFILLAFFPIQAHANLFGGVLCDTPFIWASTNPADYCNSRMYNSTDMFSDVDDRLFPEAGPAIEAISRMNIFVGYDQTYCTNNGLLWPCFEPFKNISRWEVAAAITRYHVYIKRDWYSWDPANDPDPAKCNCVPPTKNADGTYLADVGYYDNGDMEMHTALLYNWFRGGDCSGFYAPDPNIPGNVIDNQPGHNNKSIGGSERCFGPQGDWRFGFHGVDRADEGYMSYESFPINTPPANHLFYYCNYYSPVQDGSEGTCEEAWHGAWYKFASGGDSPYYMTRLDFAYQMYQYYLEEDNNNYCAVHQTGTIAGTSLVSDPDNPIANVCVIHAGQTSCNTPITWNTTNTMNNACNRPAIYDLNSNLISTGISGTFTSANSTGNADIKEYDLRYQWQMNEGYLTTGQFNYILNSMSFYGKHTSGTITFPGGGCTIPSGPATSCSQPLSWSSKLVTNAATLVLKDITNNVVVDSNKLSNNGLNYTISGTTTFGLYENGVLLTSASVTPNKLRGISGTVRVDYNDNAAVDVAPNGPPDGPFTEGTTVTLVNQGNGTTTTTTTDASGAFSFPSLSSGAYNVSISAIIPSANYPDGLHPSSVQTNPIGVALISQDAVVNFYISPYYRVTGGVFIDTNKNGKKDAGESYYTAGAITITNSNGGTITYPASGQYQAALLPAGQQTITYTSAIPNGYIITFPKGGAGSPSYTVQVGKDCAATPVTPTGGDGTCLASGNITNLNFGISNSTPWIQGIGFDMRFDGGLTNTVPSLNNACGGIYTMMPTNAADTTTQGGVYIGSSSVNGAFGVRSTPSSKGWVMDTLYPETFKPVVSGTIRTSYSYILGAVTRAALTQTDINTINTCTDPSISCSMPNLASGVYTHTGDVILSALTIPANRNVILLIKGNLSITGNITVPNTSTLTVAVGDNAGGTAGNITVASSLGGAPACVPPAGQLQGFFTADKNMTISGTNDCTVGADQMLTVEGAIVVNASLSSGAFAVNRDLCANDTNYPTFMIKERPDFIFHAPDLIKQQNYLFREAAP